MAISEIRNRKSKWSYRRTIHRCAKCRRAINQPWWFEVFDSRDNSKGPHHLACADEVLKESSKGL